MKNKEYKSGYTMQQMIDRVVYWFYRYKGIRTEDGKDYSKFDLKILIDRLNVLAKNTNKFDFNHPEMGVAI